MRLPWPFQIVCQARIQRSLSLELALLIAILRRDEIAVTNNRDR